MNNQYIKIEKKGSIGKVTITKEESLNALSSEVLSELKHTMDVLEQDTEVRCIIITGKGKAFVAGADIAQINRLSGMEGKEYAIQGQETLNLIENLNKPIIAMINGYALGGGCELAMSCDIRIASDKAKFGLPEVTLGIIPGNGGTQRLPRLTGKGIAKYLILTGKVIDADTAKDFGLVDMTVDDSALEDTAFEIARDISANGPLAVSLAKKAVNQSDETTLKEGIEREADLYNQSFLTEDRKIGMHAFLNREKARFKGE